MFKKIIAIILAFTLCFVFVGCGNDGTSSTGADEGESGAFTMLVNKPDDWDSNFKAYYEMDADGNPVFSGDTTGLYAPIHSKLIEEVDSVGFRSAISKGKTVCMFTAVWCGPCRLMYPRLENVAKQLGKGYRFIKVDIDHCRAIAQEYNCTTIPVIILFENGKELRRITSSAYGEEDIMKFVEGR